MMTKTWTVEVEEDADGNTVLPLPKEMIDELGWFDGDMLDFDINEETGVCIVKNITSDARNGKVV